VGLGDVQAEGESLRYMDKPSKNCKGGTPGNGCSIDEWSQFYEGMNVHYSSGIFNRAYYLLATTPDWNPKKAFDVMVQANRYYWTSTTSFASAACGVVRAARDYKYDLNAVVNAFQVVGIDASKCTK
jgi:Zn-dependent metalloprotease